MYPVTQVPGTFVTRLVWLVTQWKSIFRRITSPPIQALSLWNKILGTMENPKCNLEYKTNSSGLSSGHGEGFVRQVTDKTRIIRFAVIVSRVILTIQNSRILVPSAGKLFPERWLFAGLNLRIVFIASHESCDKPYEINWQVHQEKQPPPLTAPYLPSSSPMS